jgi:hypothetical protein
MTDALSGGPGPSRARRFRIAAVTRITARPPHSSRTSVWHDSMAAAELGLGHFDAAIEEANKAIDAGYSTTAAAP